MSAVDCYEQTGLISSFYTTNKAKEYSFEIAFFRQLELGNIPVVGSLILVDICWKFGKTISLVAVNLYKESLNRSPSLHIANVVAILKAFV
jgi:hypothetical protein